MEIDEFFPAAGDCDIPPNIPWPPPDQDNDDDITYLELFKGNLDSLVDSEQEIMHVVLLLGNTGSGKSTVSKILASDLTKLHYVKLPDTRRYIIIDEDDEIGLPSTRSKTLVPIKRVLFDENTREETIFYDCPGFQDNRGPVQDFAANYFMKTIIRKIVDIKLAFLVVYTSILIGYERTDFDALATHAVKYVLGLNKFEYSAALIITKTPNRDEMEEISDDDVIDMVIVFLNQYKKDLQEKLEDLEDWDLEEKLLLEKKIKFVEMFMQKNGDGKYFKISLSRTPEKCGPLSESVSTANSRLHMLDTFKHITYTTPVSEDDFGYSLKDKTLADIKSHITTLFNEVSTEVANCCERFQNWYLKEKLWRDEMDLLLDQLAPDTENIDTIENNILDAWDDTKQIIDLGATFSEESLSITEKLEKLNSVFARSIGSIGFAVSTNFKKFSEETHFLLKCFSEVEGLGDLEASKNPVQSIVNLSYKIRDYRDWILLCAKVREITKGYEFQDKIKPEYYSEARSVSSYQEETKWLDFLQKYSIVHVDEHIREIYSKLAEQYKLVLENVLLYALEKTERKINNGTVQYTGNFIRIKEIRESLSDYANRDFQLEILAAHTVYFDSELVFQDARCHVHVSILAPYWYIAENRSILLQGHRGDLPIPDRALSGGGAFGRNGIHGIPGNPGFPGGSFFGLGMNTVTQDKGVELKGTLSLKSIGGNGGRGQHGEHGSKGRDGNDANVPANKKCKEHHKCFPDAYYGEICYWYWNPDRYSQQGEPGQAGGKGGDGGVGGKPGGYGSICEILFNDRNTQRVQKSMEHGITGAGGEGGHGGEGGKSGRTWSCNKNDGNYHGGGIPGWSGNWGEASKNVYGQKEPPKPSMLEQWKPVIHYCLEYSSNVGMQTSKFLHRFQSDEDFQSTFKIQNFLDELLLLEIFSEEDGVALLYSGMKTQLSLRAEQIPSGDKDEETVLEIMKSTVEGKLASISSSMAGFIVDMVAYIGMVQGYTENLNVAEALVVVQKEKQRYEAIFTKNLEKTKTTIVNIVLPSIRSAEESLEESLRKLEQEFIRLVETARENLDDALLQLDSAWTDLKRNQAMATVKTILGGLGSVLKLDIGSEGFNPVTPITGLTDIFGSLANDLYFRYQNDITKVHTLEKLVHESQKYLEDARKRKQQIEEMFVPMVDALAKSIDEILKEFENPQIIQTDIDVTLYQFRAKVREILFTLSALSEGIDDTKFVLATRNIEEAMLLLADLNENILEYQQEKRLGEYISVLTNPGLENGEIQNPVLKQGVLELRKAILQNVVIRKSKMAVRAFQLWVFPFANNFFSQFPGIWKTSQNTDEITRQVGQMQLAIQEYKAITVSDIDTYLFTGEFSSSNASTVPFFVWKNNDFKSDIENILSGYEANLHANISSSTQGFQSIKFRKIDLVFKITEDAEDKDRLETILRDQLIKCNVVITHNGVSFYRFANQYFTFSAEPQTFVYSIEVGEDGEHLHENEIYRKFKAGDFMMSPYTSWNIRLEPTIPEEAGEEFFAELKKLADFVDLELAGNGMYVRENEELVNKFNSSKCYETEYFGRTDNM